MKYRSAVLYEGDFVVDLYKYGARPVVESKIFYINGSHHFYMGAGVRVTKGLVDNLIPLISYDVTFIEHLKRAIKKYYTQRKLRGIIRSLVFLNKHFYKTMELSYAPDGAGYFRVKKQYETIVHCIGR